MYALPEYDRDKLTIRIPKITLLKSCSLGILPEASFNFQWNEKNYIWKISYENV